MLKLLFIFGSGNVNPLNKLVEKFMMLRQMMSYLNYSVIEGTQDGTVTKLMVQINLDVSWNNTCCFLLRVH